MHSKLIFNSFANGWFAEKFERTKLVGCWSLNHCVSLMFPFENQKFIKIMRFHIFDNISVGNPFAILNPHEIVHCSMLTLFNSSFMHAKWSNQSPPISIQNLLPSNNSRLKNVLYFLFKFHPLFCLTAALNSIAPISRQPSDKWKCIYPNDSVNEDLFLPWIKFQRMLVA